LKAKPIASYYDVNAGDVLVQVYAIKKSRKEERTFPNKAGSVFLLGRKCVGLRDIGIYSKSGAK